MQEPSLDAVVGSADLLLKPIEGHTEEYLERIAEEAEHAWRDLCSQYGITHNDYPGNYFRSSPDKTKN